MSGEPQGAGPQGAGPQPGGATGRARVEALVRELGAEHGLDLEAGARRGEWVLTLPGERKLRTVVSLVVGERALRALAFVIRNPDENHEQVYRWLLRRNLRTPGLAYAIDEAGDVWVRARLPLQAVDAAELDRLLGAVLEASDGAFDELLALGFLTSMRTEWAWRVSRGESTRNLEAFRHLLEEPGAGPVPGSRA